jgi:hypothetical protein
MKYKSFIRIILVIIAVAVIGSVVIIGGCITLIARHANQPTPVVQNPPPTATPTGGGGGAVQQPTRATTEELKQKLGLWLTLNSDRHGLMKKENILPNESFRATAIRFPQSDAVKWSNKDSQWSQIKIDLDRNGLDDEKWLLKNGELYKREVIDSSGKTTFMEYFK